MESFSKSKITLEVFLYKAKNLMKLFQILQVKYLEFSNEHWKYPFNFFRILIKYQWLHLPIVLVSILKTLWNFSSIVPISSAKTPILSQRETRLSKQIKNDSDRLLCWSRAEHLHYIWEGFCVFCACLALRNVGFSNSFLYSHSMPYFTVLLFVRLVLITPYHT